MSGIYTFRKLVLLVLGICWLNTLGAAEPEKVVYKVDIKDEIGPEVWRLARKSFDLAWQEKADYILIHMNTYGGMVVYADSLRSMILQEDFPCCFAKILSPAVPTAAMPHRRNPTR